MFKRVGIGVLVVVMLLLGVAGTTLAQPALSMGGHGRGGYGSQGVMHEALAEALGLTVEDLYAALAEGQTVAELAEAQGVELDDVVAAVLALHVERVEQAVEDGYMSQELADLTIELMAARLTWKFENGGMGGYGGCGMRGGMWGGGVNAPRAPVWQSQPEV